MLLNTAFLFSSGLLYPEFRKHLSTTDISEAMNTLFQQTYVHIDSCHSPGVSKNKEVEVYFAKLRYGLLLLSNDLGSFFASNFENDFGVGLREKGSHYSDFDCDIVRIHSVMLYTALIVYIFLLATWRLHFCIALSPFQSSKSRSTKLLNRTWTITHLVTYNSCRCLEFYHSVLIDSRHTSGEKVIILSFGIAQLVFLFEKLQYSIFKEKTPKGGCFIVNGVFIL